MRDISIKKSSEKKRDVRFELQASSQLLDTPPAVLRFLSPKKTRGLFWVDIFPFPRRNRLPGDPPTNPRLKGSWESP